MGVLYWRVVACFMMMVLHWLAVRVAYFDSSLLPTFYYSLLGRVVTGSSPAVGWTYGLGPGTRDYGIGLLVLL